MHCVLTACKMLEQRPFALWCSISTWAWLPYILWPLRPCAKTSLTPLFSKASITGFGSVATAIISMSHCFSHPAQATDRVPRNARRCTNHRQKCSAIDKASVNNQAATQADFDLNTTQDISYGLPQTFGRRFFNASEELGQFLFKIGCLSA